MTEQETGVSSQCLISMSVLNFTLSAMLDQSHGYGISLLTTTMFREVTVGAVGLECEWFDKANPKR